MGKEPREAQKNMIKRMIKRDLHKRILVCLVFEILVLYSFYLYSLRCDFVFWGSSLRDGLYFLEFFILIVPVMVILSVLKVFLKLANTFFRFNYFLYTLLIAIPGIGDAYSQTSLMAGMTICIVVFFLNIVEFFLNVRT